MMKKSNSKVKIQEAFINLLKEKDLDKITIMDIVRGAGISRNTYYYFYYEQKEILDDIINSFFQELQSAFDSSLTVSSPDYKLTVSKGTECFYEYKDVLSVLFKSTAETHFRERFFDVWTRTGYQWVEQFNLPWKGGELHDQCMFSGIYNIYKKWIETGSKESTETISNFIANYCERMSDNPL